MASRTAAALLCFLALAGPAARADASEAIPLPQPENFSTMTWTQAFESFHAKFSREYAFTSWKSIDWAGLRGLYLPRITAAQAADDRWAYLTALRGYVLSIPDGHVSIKSPDLTAREEERTAGGFGLCLTGLDDGRVVAHRVLAGGPAAGAGMLAGAEITQWNGLPIATALAQVDLLWRKAFWPIATDAYERLERFTYLARAPAGTPATVVFRNDGAPAAQTAVLSAVNDDFATIKQANFAAPPDSSAPPIAFKMLPSGHGYLRVTMEGSTQSAYDDFRRAIQAFVDAGVPGVIVDLRDNAGGDDAMAARYAGFFHDAPSFYEYQNYFNAQTGLFEIGLDDEHGGAVRGGSLSIEPQTPRYNGPVRALVRPMTISSGEGVALGIARAPRGQVVGFYGTNGSFGMLMGDGATLPGGVGVEFPSGQSLDESKIVQLDSRGGVGGVAPTLRVPRTESMVLAFANGEDPELAFAIDTMPPAPPKLSACAVSSAAIRWSWPTSGGLAGDFQLFYATGTLLAALPNSATFYLETGLSSATAYSRYLLASNPSGQAFSSTVTVVTPGLGSYISGTSSQTLTGSDGQARLIIPISLQGAATGWMLSESPLQRPLTGDTTALIVAAVAPAGLRQSTGSLTEFIIAVDGVRSSGTLDPPVTVRIPYSDVNNTGFVDGTSPPVRADTLQLYTLNETSGLWEAVPGSTVDTVDKVVVGQLSHLSIFTAFGAGAVSGLSTLRVYPVPYRPNGGNADQGKPYSAADPNSGIIFDNLPQSVIIRIYTLTGSLVTSFSSEDSSGKLRWDARNDSGQDVATGGYLAVITSPGAAKVVKKILIIR
ncbi:MAG: S41 family peptidase [Elusimicrobia bacterium]|nr:S41 family peptidase [Elusimicrobiota bacterium]